MGFFRIYLNRQRFTTKTTYCLYIFWGLWTPFVFPDFRFRKTLSWSTFLFASVNGEKKTVGKNPLKMHKKIQCIGVYREC